MKGRVYTVRDDSVDPARPWRVFLQDSPESFVCVYNGASEADCEPVRGAVENVVRGLCAEAAQKAINECAGRALASPSLMDAIDLIGQADAEAIAAEVLP